MQVAFFYTLFAGIAMAANIASQELTIRFYGGPHGIGVAILIGTGVGLITKFLLDRQYIFHATSRPLRREFSQFLAYSITGILTTLLFWGTEIGFDLLFGTRQARYGGAVLGLSIGYLIKYQLDRRFVFNVRNT